MPRKRLIFDECYVIDEITGCWNWTKAKIGKGYGNFCLNFSTRKLSHIYTYERKYGKIPAGLVMHHICENKGCCNPDHVIPKTNAENCRLGKNAKINMEIANAIRKAVEEDIRTYKSLAAQYGIHSSMVGYIIKNKNWKIENNATTQA